MHIQYKNKFWHISSVYFSLRSIIFILLACLYSLIILGCGSPTHSGYKTSGEISTKALWENEKEVKLEYILTIGNDDFEEDENYYFAAIRDFTLDQHGNLYVLDNKTMRINKYTPNGIFMQSIALVRGNGPAEFTWPMKVALDKEDNLYITNHHGRIIVLDKNGKLIKQIRAKGTLAFMVVDSDKNIYLTKGSGTNIPRIFKYNPQGELVNSFCKINNDKLLEFLGKVGDWECLSVDHENNIYYSAIYPYEIRKFSPEGNLLKCFSREAGFKEPYIKILHGFKLTKAASASIGITVLPDGKILNIIRHRKQLKDNKTEYECWFDLFSKEGKWLISFSSERLKIERIYFFALDPNGYLYVNCINPYPHIKKFKIEVVDKNGKK